MTDRTLQAARKAAPRFTGFEATRASVVPARVAGMRARFRLFPAGHNPLVAGLALFLWLQPGTIAIAVLLRRSGSDAGWWGVFTATIVALLALAARSRRIGSGAGQPLRDGFIDMSLLAVIMVGGTWAVEDPLRVQFQFTRLVYLLVLLYPFIHNRRDTLIIAAANYGVVFGVTAWTHLALPATHAIPWPDTLARFWPLVLVAASAQYFGGLMRRQTDLQEQVASFSRVDALTGLAARPAFLQCAERAVAEARAGGPVCVLILMDLDGLKDINDSFGHPVGDATLQHMAGVIRACMGLGDQAARFGGDEFAALAFPRAGEDPKDVIERYSGAMESTVFHDEDTGQTLLLSASWGAATAGPDTPDLLSLFARADEHLIYRKSLPRMAPVPEGVIEGPFVPRGRRALAEALGSVLDLARDIASADDGPEFLRRAATRAAELVGAMSASVSICRGDERWGSRAQRVSGRWEHGPSVFPSRRSIQGHVLNTGAPHVCNDIAHDPLADQDAARRLGITNCLCVPLRGTDGRVFGTLFLSNKLGRAPFNDHDVQLAQAFAGLASAALEKDEALAAAREETRIAGALARAVATVHETLEPNEVVSRVLLEAATLLTADVAAVAVVEDGGTLRVVATHHGDVPEQALPPVPVGEGVVGRVAATGEPYLSNDLATDPYTVREVDNAAHFRAQIAVPVCGQDGAVVGVITTLNTAARRAFTPRDLRLLETFAHHVGAALERAGGGIDNVVGQLPEETGA